MDIRRRERSEYAVLFDGFSFTGKIIALNIVINLFVFLWSMPVSYTHLVSSSKRSTFSASHCQITSSPWSERMPRGLHPPRRASQSAARRVIADVVKHTAALGGVGSVPPPVDSSRFWKMLIQTPPLLPSL